MAVIKRFFFDGEEIREEKGEQKGNKGNAGNTKDARSTANAANIAKQPGNNGVVSGKRTASGDEELCMLVSSLLGKNGKQYARVSFMRGEDTAEGIVPDGRLERVSGFSEEEAAGLKLYLAANKDAILAQAKQIDPLTNWLRTPPGK